MGETRWLEWEELTAQEQVQAMESYRSLRADEEGMDESGVDGDGVRCCRFERMPDGYIYVDL